MTSSGFDPSALSAYALYRQQSDAPLRQLYFHRPMMIIVTRGHKGMTIDRTTLEAGVGEVIVASAGSFADVINTPDSGGLYEADLFTFGADLVPESQMPPAGMQRLGMFAPPADFAVTRAAARDALMRRGELPESVIAHRVGELLAWARAFGIVPSLIDPQHLPIRVRTIVSHDPARDWRIGEIAAALAMSEPTLRRHLAADGTSATEILADVRLSRALSQLQSTTLSVTEIAADAGYDSPSRFAARFRARFGFPPSEIRGRRSNIDRIGTEADRTGVAAI